MALSRTEKMVAGVVFVGFVYWVMQTGEEKVKAVEEGKKPADDTIKIQVDEIRKRLFRLEEEYDTLVSGFDREDAERRHKLPESPPMRNELERLSEELHKLLAFADTVWSKAPMYMKALWEDFESRTMRLEGEMQEMFAIESQEPVPPVYNHTTVNLAQHFETKNYLDKSFTDKRSINIGKLTNDNRRQNQQNNMEVKQAFNDQRSVTQNQLNQYDQRDFNLRHQHMEVTNYHDRMLEPDGEGPPMIDREDGGAFVDEHAAGMDEDLDDAHAETLVDAGFNQNTAPTQQNTIGEVTGTKRGKTFIPPTEIDEIGDLGLPSPFAQSERAEFLEEDPPGNAAPQPEGQVKNRSELVPIGSRPNFNASGETHIQADQTDNTNQSKRDRLEQLLERGDAGDIPEAIKLQQEIKGQDRVSPHDHIGVRVMLGRVEAARSEWARQMSMPVSANNKASLEDGFKTIMRMQPAEFSVPLAGGGHMTSTYKRVLYDSRDNMYSGEKDPDWPTVEEVKQRPDYIAWKTFASQAQKELKVYTGKRDAAGLEPLARSRSRPRSEPLVPRQPTGPGIPDTEMRETDILKSDL